MTEELSAISAVGVSKRFSREHNSLRRLWQVMAGSEPGSDFEALANVDIEIARGEAIGIVGRNGSGKSTLLQILCGTMQPTSGTVTVNRKLSAMLELGAGFNPRFTGRENARLNAAAYGIPGSAIEQRLAAIEVFADIGDYFDRPLKEYSSGMQARLAFAVSIHVDAEILVIDEILGVGDAAFQKKCHAFMQKFRAAGGTLLFVSHDPGAVSATCERAIWLETGRKMADGNCFEVLKAYADHMNGLDLPAGALLAQTCNVAAGTDCEWGSNGDMEVSFFDQTSPRHGHGGCRITDCFLTDDQGRRVERIHGGLRVTLHVQAVAERLLRSPIIGFMLRNDAGQNLFGDNTFLAFRNDPPVIEEASRFEGCLEFCMPYLPDGRYAFAPSIIEGTQSNHVQLDWREEAIFLSVRNSEVKAGHVGLTMQSITVTPFEDRSKGIHRRAAYEAAGGGD